MIYLTHDAFVVCDNVVMRMTLFVASLMYLTSCSPDAGAQSQLQQRIEHFAVPVPDKSMKERHEQWLQQLEKAKREIEDAQKRLDMIGKSMHGPIGPLQQYPTGISEGF